MTFSCVLLQIKHGSNSDVFLIKTKKLKIGVDFGPFVGGGWRAAPSCASLKVLTSEQPGNSPQRTGLCHVHFSA